ncbi:hypothetical protein MLD38_020836 [Melastoma candidum]|uniref:Uncharacterized protein n=1 Tax=Melastoma candidum TaxID=119954 RepID=A0ACB9QF46_9MYRT|nr:hypothetical protein MLD38_020836 [Melastoma candidum]
MSSSYAYVTPPKKRPKPPKPTASSSPAAVALQPPLHLLPSKHDLLRLLAVVLIASTIAASLNLLAGLFNPGQKPFCDSVSDAAEDWVEDDSCEPCPAYGECHDGKLECIRGYKRQGRICVEDGDVSETARNLAQWAESRLCDGYVRFLCYGTGTSWVSAEDILKNMDGHPARDNFLEDTALYIFAKQKAMEAIEKSSENRRNSLGLKELKCPDAIAEHFKPYTCRLRQWIVEHILLVLPSCLMLVGSLIFLQKIRRRHYLSSRVEEIYDQVCDILEENALMSKESIDRLEPWVVAARLRDHVLLPKERKDPVLWKKVEELVQEDSRVDRYPKLVKGEQKEVWEWQVEGNLSSSRKWKKGETSATKSSPGSNRTNFGVATGQSTGSGSALSKKQSSH